MITAIFSNSMYGDTCQEEIVNVGINNFKNQEIKIEQITCNNEQIQSKLGDIQGQNICLWWNSLSDCYKDIDVSIIIIIFCWMICTGTQYYLIFKKMIKQKLITIQDNNDNVLDFSNIQKHLDLEINHNVELQQVQKINIDDIEFKSFNDM